MADRITVQLVDDHFLFASALAGVIKGMERYRVVGIAVTGPQALAMVREERPDIVLLDYHLPGYSADMLLPRFLAASPGTRVIVLTSDTSDDAMINSVRAGAIGFMTKDKAIDDVLDALGAVADGGTLLTRQQREIAGVAPTLPPSVSRAAPARLPPSPSPLLGGSFPLTPAAAPPVDERASQGISAPSTSPALPAPEHDVSPLTSPALRDAVMAELITAAPMSAAEPVELRLVGVGSFAQAVLIERFIERLPQVGQVYIREVGGDRALLRVSLEAGATAEGLARELVDGSRRLRVTAAERGILELQVEAPLVDG